MSRFFSAPNTIKRNKIFIEGKEAHHLLKVMRLKSGDKVVIFNGEGKEYQGIIIEEKRNSALVEIFSERELKLSKELSIILAQSIPAKNKMGYLIEKATELGVDKIIPLETERSVVKVNKEKAESVRRRWEKIALSAGKQCGRIKLPVISDITKFSQVLNRGAEFDLVLFPCLSSKTVPLKRVLEEQKGEKNILVFIGPEGGFSPKEIERAELNGSRLVSLGANVLKSDTAGLSVLSILQYEYRNG